MGLLTKLGTPKRVRKNASELGLSGERDKLGQITLNALSVPREWTQVSDIYSLCVTVSSLLVMAAIIFAINYCNK